jgi:hypothetical protein
MPLKYRVATSNSGNDGIGQTAASKLNQVLKQDDLDLMVLLCQETHFKHTLEQLKEVLNPNYTATWLSQMHTHTKISTAFSRAYGMGCLVITKKGVSLDDSIESKIIRRSYSGHWGSNYNKGAVFTRFSLNKLGQTYTIDSISGHLDSNKPLLRNSDWTGIFSAYHGEHAISWSDLSKKTPDLLVSGFDTNTRNHIGEGSITNPWLSNHPEIGGMSLARLGNQLFSAENTYKTNDPNNAYTQDKKRGDVVKGGSLDIVGIMNPSATNQLEINNPQTVTIGLYPDESRRDHAIVVSPSNIVKTSSDFERIKIFIASELKSFAPLLSQYCQDLSDTGMARLSLLHTYNSYLASPNGLIHQSLNLQAKKLALFYDLPPSERHRLYEFSSVPIVAKTSSIFDIKYAHIDRLLFKLESNLIDYLEKANNAVEREAYFTIYQQSLDWLQNGYDPDLVKLADILMNINNLLCYYQNQLQLGAKNSDTLALDDENVAYRLKILSQFQSILLGKEGSPQAKLMKVNNALKSVLGTNLFGKEQESAKIKELMHSLAKINAGNNADIFSKNNSMALMQHGLFQVESSDDLSAIRQPFMIKTY